MDVTDCTFQMAAPVYRVPIHFTLTPLPPLASAQGCDCVVSRDTWQLRLGRGSWWSVHLDLWGCSSLEPRCHNVKTPNGCVERPHVGVPITAATEVPTLTTSQVPEDLEVFPVSTLRSLWWCWVEQRWNIPAELCTRCKSASKEVSLFSVTAFWSTFLCNRR